MRRLLTYGLLLCVSLAGCGGGSSSPTSVSTPPPVATPTPVPTPTPTPAAIACASPTPPPLFTFRVKVQLDFGYKKILDSRALVGRDTSYCSYWGYGGDVCVARDETSPDAVTCSNLVVGVASQTGRYGPNWYSNNDLGRPCRGANEGDQDPGCKQHPDNQFFVLAFGPGMYMACGDKDRICVGLEID